MIKLLQRGFAYACTGLLVETFFTGFLQLLHGDLHLTTTSYLVMLPVYGTAGLFYDWLQQKTQWNQLKMAVAYLPLLYGQEFAWGLVFRWSIGCPWNYGNHWWTPMTLVNLAYAPLWFGLVYAFPPARLLFRRWSALR